SAFLAFLSRARKRIVSHRVRDQSKIRARIYNHFVDNRMRDMHTVDYNLALLEPLCGRNASRVVHLELPEVALEKANKLRRDLKIGARFIIFHPGSARIEKFWDPARWAEVINHAGQNNDVDLVLTSGPSRLEQAHVTEIKTKTRPRIVDLSGRTDLLTLAALIAQARLLVTGVQTPQVVLFGPTNPFHWRPRESPALVLQGESRTPLMEFSPVRARLPMSQISTEAVIDAMNSLLSPQATTQTS